MSDPANTVPAATLAKLLMMTERHLRRLVSDGWIQKTPDDKYTVVGGVQGYIRFLKDEARRGMGSGSEAKTYMSEAKARLAKEQADNMELKNAQLRDELIPANEVKHTWSQWATDIRAAFLALPSRIQQRVLGLTPADVSIIDEEVRAILTDLAKVDVEESAGEAGRGATVRPATETQTIPVD